MKAPILKSLLLSAAKWLCTAFRMPDSNNLVYLIKMDADHLTPSYLRALGYSDIPQVKELAARAILDKGGTDLEAVRPWSTWAGIFDYICCVEFARASLLGLPTGKQLGSVNIVPARYHSASLVFFARATLDNVAVWIATHLQLAIKGSHCGFHKTRFLESLASAAPLVAERAETHRQYFARLEKYRQEWIHRLAGGATIFSDKSPSDVDADIKVMVQINPADDVHGDSKAFVRAVARTRTNNNGEWLLPVAQFANEMADGVKSAVMDILAEILKEPKFARPNT